MLTLRDEFSTILAHFAPRLSGQVGEHAQVLLIGTILARGQRTVAAARRVMGLSDEACFVNDHRVLQRAVWSSRAVSQALLQVLVRTFVPRGTIVLGGDETIERRRGAQLKAKGTLRGRDPVRSSHRHFVKASGLRWVPLRLLVPIPFAGRVWALPVLTLLAPSERYYAARRRAAKKLTDWMRQGLLQVRRYWPTRKLAVVADASYACLNLLSAMIHLPNPITMVVRFRMDAALFAPTPERQPGTKGRPRKRGLRVPKLTSVAADRQTRWQRRVVPCWYGERNRRIELTSGTAVWSNSGQPVVPIRWVIDVIIRRTLQYSVLSGLLALVYFGLIVILQGFFTAAIAALFLPLRRRVQDFIDRRFYRKKYDAAQVIADFATTCRAETDLDHVTARLAGVVQETMQPENVILWLKPASVNHPPAGDGRLQPP